MNKVLVIAALSALLLSGCSGKSSGPEELLEEVPDEIDQQKVSDLEAEIAAKFPRAFSFPGQQVIEPIRFFINGTISPGDGAASPELPNDNGLVDGNPTYVRHDVSQHVPVGQPVEMRIKLKWFGNPGASADLDILTDMPGNRGAYDPDSWDESMNWGIVTKFGVVNTVHADGQPFELGVQVSNGRVLVADMAYSIQVDVEYAHGVLAPGIAYGINVPANASRLVVESEPLGGDEHIHGEYLIIDPNDRLLRHEKYNDIGNDARAITVREAGEYVVYAPHLRGGFLRLSTDVPNEGYEARILDTTVHEAALAESVLPPTGGSGSFDAPGFPLEMHAWLAPTSAAPAGIAGNAALNITSEDGWVTTTMVTGYAGGGDMGRVGNRITSVYDNANLATGSYSWTVEGSAAAAMDAGYRLVTYTR